jgi:hypothetical protein
MAISTKLFLLIEKGADLNKEDKRSGRVLLHELCAVDEFTEANLKIINKKRF